MDILLELAEVLLDALLDSLKTLPFLFGAYLLIEFIEHHSSGKFTRVLQQSGPLGPIAGALSGCLPQCGFSVAAANLFSGKMITIGTLIAVFISTSDEAILILISKPDQFPTILKLLAIKVLAGILIGILIDLIFRRLNRSREEATFKEICSHCDCEHVGIFRSALSHTIKIFLFLLSVNIILGLIINWVGTDKLSEFLLSGSVFQPFLSALIGFIPNCAASILLTDLYISGSLSFGSTIAGLCTGAGLGLVILFKTNKNIKQNMLIVGILYVSAVITGMLVNFAFI